MLGGHGYRQLSAALCATAGVVAVAVARVPTPVDGPVLDLLVAVRAWVAPRSAATLDEPVAVVALDARSLGEPEIARYPRTFLTPIWAAVLDGVLGAGARTVGLDLIFAYSANEFAPDFDRPFLAALGRHRERVVLARSTGTPPAAPFLAALLHDEDALGLVDLRSDPDGRYRRVQTLEALPDGGALPAFTAAVLRRAQRGPIPSQVLLAPRRHLERIPTYATIDVLRCARTAPEALQAVFAERIVIVGSTLPEEDRKVPTAWGLTPARADGPMLHPCGLRRLGASAPDSETVPGVFVHAAAVEAVAAGRVTSTAHWTMVGALAGAAGVAGAVLGLSLSPWLTLASCAGVALLLLAGGVAALAGDVWIPLAWPLATLVGAPAVAYVVRYLVVERQRRRVQHAFGHYLAPAIVERLVQDPAALRLGGERRDVTVMFADLSGFTALSSRVEPEVLTRLTNRYLGLIVESVEATGGYVDKFIGDAVMAVWGAPASDPAHAVHAVRAALAAVARSRAEWRTAVARGEPALSLKIGLNSGPAVVGNVGTERRYNYTAVGETVNVASRLESVPGLYGCQIVVGPRTAELAREEIFFREIDWVRVKGRETPLAIFEPLAEVGDAARLEIDQAKRYGDALAYYRARRFDEAAAIWEALTREEGVVVAHAQGPSQPSPASTMANRARQLAADPPDERWDGVFSLGTK
jgi:class 3 adenylate cyclase